MVVLILPILVRRESLASSVAKAGVSHILSLSTLEHFGELANAEMYKSPKVSIALGLMSPGLGRGLVNTA